MGRQVPHRSSSPTEFRGTRPRLGRNHRGYRSSPTQASRESALLDHYVARRIVGLPCGYIGIELGNDHSCADRSLCLDCSARPSDDGSERYCLEHLKYWKPVKTTERFFKACKWRPKGRAIARREACEKVCGPHRTPTCDQTILIELMTGIQTRGSAKSVCVARESLIKRLMRLHYRRDTAVKALTRLATPTSPDADDFMVKEWNHPGSGYGPVVMLSDAARKKFELQYFHPDEAATALPGDPASAFKGSWWAHADKKKSVMPGGAPAATWRLD